MRQAFLLKIFLRFQLFNGKRRFGRRAAGDVHIRSANPILCRRGLDHQGGRDGVDGGPRRKGRGWDRFGAVGAVALGLCMLSIVPGLTVLGRYPCRPTLDRLSLVTGAACYG